MPPRRHLRCKRYITPASPCISTSECCQSGMLSGKPTCVCREAQQHLQRQLSLVQLSAAASWCIGRCPPRRRRRQRRSGGLVPGPSARASGPGRPARQACDAGGPQALQQRVHGRPRSQQAQQAGGGVQHEAQRAQRLHQVPLPLTCAGAAFAAFALRVAISCCACCRCKFSSGCACGARLCCCLLLGTKHPGSAAQAAGIRNSRGAQPRGCTRDERTSACPPQGPVAPPRCARRVRVTGNAVPAHQRSSALDSWQCQRTCCAP